MLPAAPTLEELLEGYAGFLTDRCIHVALEGGFLIERGTWDAQQVRHASYTIRLGHRVELERNSARWLLVVNLHRLAVVED